MKSRIITVTIVILLAAIFGAGAFGGRIMSASAHTARAIEGSPAPAAAGQPVQLMGKVSSKSANSLTLTTLRGDFTVNVSSDTFIMVEQNGQRATATLSDLAANKATLVVGTATSDAKVVDARLIAQGAGNIARFLANHPGARRALEHTAAGTITGISGSTITLKGVNVDTVVVETLANTVVLNNGFTSVSSLKVGDKVAILGKPDKAANGTQLPSTRTIKAWGIRVENNTTELRIARVDTVSGNTMTVKTPRNRDGLTVILDANTAYKVLTINRADMTTTLSPAAQADVKAKSNLIVEGTVSADGKSITARAIIILPDGNRR